MTRPIKSYKLWQQRVNKVFSKKGNMRRIILIVEQVGGDCSIGEQIA